MRIGTDRNKKIMLALLILWGAVLCVIFGLTLTQSVSAKLEKLPVYSVDTGNEKKTAITFDVAWGDETTDEILNILSENNIKASFFFVGEYAAKYPESVKKIYNSGHDIGNHSMHHNNPQKQSSEELLNDINECNELLFSLTGKMPTLYRAPSGAYDEKTMEVAEGLNMSVIQWDNDSIDWKDISAEKMTERIMKKLSPGSIMLFHLGKANTLEALPGIIEKIKENGYEIVPVSELLLQGETYVDSNGKQHGRSNE